ncbi:hypothetical protein P167DRAFT_533350 [Morchella conica CCBAS932]|uniref:DUF6594 domain-containing protein n=1 Tax=Morchella conica CCBAS932 TaxID=1392247 RepID=A0A3N4KX72_9PEZI|nr:hypothetical protein P167DRAFT_533350 [Morchella conica CCBAS932]
MTSSTTDSWNNPQSPPPPPSPAVVGARFRDTSPTADADYEARFPELPKIDDPNTAKTATTATTTTAAESAHPQRSESTSRASHKKKRTRSTGVEDATPRPRQPIPVPSQYMNVPYYPPPYQNSPESHRAYQGSGYYDNAYGCGNGGYSPHTQMRPLQAYPFVSPLHVRDSFCGNSYPPPPVHYPHPLPTPPPVMAYMKKAPSEGSDCQRYDNATRRGSQSMKACKSVQEGEVCEKRQGEGDVSSNIYLEEKKCSTQMLSSTPYYATPPPSPTFRVPTGYPFLAETLSTTPSLQLYRRFSKLNHLVLLHLQDEISELESVLSELDEQEYIHNNGASLRARRGMGSDSRRLQVMGAIAFKLQQYNKALKGYREMTDALSPIEKGDLEVYKAWMIKRRPLVEAEGRVLGDHPEDLARLHRRPRKSEVEFSPALKVGLTMLSCGIAGVASLRVSRAADVPLALAAGMTGGAAAMMWAFF